MRFSQALSAIYFYDTEAASHHLVPHHSHSFCHHDCVICARTTNAILLIHTLSLPKITLTQHLISPATPVPQYAADWSKTQLHALMRLSVLHVSPVANDFCRWHPNTPTIGPPTQMSRKTWKIKGFEAQKDGHAAFSPSPDISQHPAFSIFDDRRCCRIIERTSATAFRTSSRICPSTFSAALPCLDFLSCPSLACDTPEIPEDTTGSIRLCGHGAAHCIMQHYSGH